MLRSVTGIRDKIKTKSRQQRARTKDVPGQKVRNKLRGTYRQGGKRYLESESDKLGSIRHEEEKGYTRTKVETGN